MDAGHIEPFHAGRVRLPRKEASPRGLDQVVIQPGPCPPRTSGAPTLLTRPFPLGGRGRGSALPPALPRRQESVQTGAVRLSRAPARPVSRSRRGWRPITTTPARAASYGRRSPCTHGL